MLSSLYRKSAPFDRFASVPLGVKNIKMVNEINPSQGVQGVDQAVRRLSARRKCSATQARTIADTLPLAVSSASCSSRSRSAGGKLILTDALIKATAPLSTEGADTIIEKEA